MVDIVRRHARALSVDRLACLPGLARGGAGGHRRQSDHRDAARDRASSQGLIVNGLVLGDRDEAAEVAAYFRDHVQTGPGSFVLVARAFQDVTRAMLAKFLVELAALPATGEPQLR
jgi:hypothetical protein